ncbi:Flp family type IVb pilin [Pseudomonas sp. C32]|uniref:Flp family type IVb pilin n=1 Tax=Pseudomonas sp. C32 TaxID=1529208 RepID=UPI00261A95A9|nr:Flp family type IVb pilin [Pseudomonas sp. C32]MDN4547511.1 Flp family type IVb pilin [Pseudomonas sp. C32]
MSISTLVQKVKLEIVFFSYRRLVRDTEGASGIEYAIVAAMVAVVIAGLSSDLGDDIKTIFGQIGTALGRKAATPASPD